MTVSHFIMQGKGGVGKSLVSSILIQYLLKQDLEVSGCDTDPVNSSLAKYKSLDIKVLDIMAGEDIDPSRFDGLIQLINSAPAEAHLVVDIGASCFVSLCAYLKRYSAFEVLQDMGHSINIHTIITGGVNLVETMNNLRSLANHFNVPIIVWLNHFFGEIKIGNDRFENFKIYHELAGSLRGIVDMPNLGSTLFARDFADMLAGYQTFEEALQSPKFYLMSRSRLFRIWGQYQQAIGQIGLV
jgi:hypothetical protein